MPKKNLKRSDENANSSEEDNVEKQGKKSTSAKTDISQNKKLATETASKSKPTTAFFAGVDLSKFWDDESGEPEEPPSDEKIKSVEEELGYKLPASYVALMKLHNGGYPKNKCFPTNQKNSWSHNHVAMESFFSIDSLVDEQENWIQEWQYPATGVYICDCPSGGHDLIMLDYADCGKNGEPKVVHVDQEFDYKKITLADNFEAFVRGLQPSSAFDYAAAAAHDEDEEEDEE
mmetsp:Transcript_5339/g.7499  ORF Transcript_5339/g.7499 Transcript_5339/m.7499 type:complete len:232 (+) Transcript_5339:86-781(+)